MDIPHALVAFLVAGAGALGAAGARGGEAAAADADRLAGAIGERYAVRIVLARASVRYELALPAGRDAELRATLEGIDRALARYPRTFLERAGLKEIRVVGGVRMGGAEFSGFARPCEGGIVLGFAERDVGRVLDHELFHVFDCAFFHRVLRRNHELPHHNVIQTMYDDFEWRDLNPRGFGYTAQIECKAEASTAIEHPLAGFASWYATCDIVEDKANLFEHLMRPAGRARLLELAQRDRVLAAKLALIASRLRAFGLELPGAIG